MPAFLRKILAMHKALKARSRAYRVVLVLVTVILGVFMGGCASVFFGQSRLVFMPPAKAAWRPSDAGLSYEDVYVEAAPGETINAWYIPVDAARGTVIFAHGNGESLPYLFDYIDFYRTLKVNVLAFDYRGYGASAGKPSEKATYEDALAAWKYLTETRGIPSSQIVLVGRSLGGAVMANLASKVQPAGLILESSFTSIPDVGAHYYPWLPIRLIARIHYDTKDIMADIHCPILIAHSPSDEVIPYSHGRTLFKLANEPKTFVNMTAGHNDSPWDKGQDFRTAVDLFLGKCFSGTME